MYKRQTKSFIGQVVSLTLLALLLAQVKYRLTTKQARMLFRELSDTEMCIRDR